MSFGNLGKFASVLAFALPAPAAHAMPFLFDDTRLWVHAEIKGLPPPGDFILDTGAANDSVDEGAAARLNLAVKEGGAVSGAGSGTSQAGVVKDAYLSFGEHQYDGALRTLDLDRLIAPSSGRHVAGIIGAPFFANRAVAIDFDRSDVRYVELDAALKAHHYVFIPLTFAFGLPLARATLTLPDGREVPLRLLVDLGAKADLLLSEPFLARAHLRTAFPETQTRILGAGLGGETRYAFARAPRITLRGGTPLNVNQVIVGLSVGGTLKSDWYDGLLGPGLLQRYNLIFDYPHARLWLSPRTLVPHSTQFDASGLTVFAEGPDLQQFTVRDVVEGGPGAAAGVHLGDTILAMNGTPATGLTLSAVRSLLSRPAGTVQLQLRGVDGDREVTVSLQRQL